MTRKKKKKKKKELRITLKYLYGDRVVSESSTMCTANLDHNLVVEGLPCEKAHGAWA